ncbi:hypothetical protein [Limnoglobus roseus]|uniref:Uncharacterized protein n=1 Tax=Limnoglobus roseus TaxID=2598579 RepID=A0A5C1AI33_9BACT|nr:hypothetical protein [Limnoglobus roseus]QEL18305.1 hypothetical protein PX52LOC_05326 [Limnoglobus roseus]
MPWVTTAELKNATASVLGQSLRVGGSNGSVNIAQHWDEPVAAAVSYARGVITRALAARGFKPEQIAAWDELHDYHRRVALCNVFREGGLGTGYDGLHLGEYCKAVAELAAVPVTIGGVIIDPKGSEGGCSSGDFDFTAEVRVPGGFAHERPRHGGCGGPGYGSDGGRGWR